MRSRDIFPEFFVGVFCCLLAKQSFHLVAAFFPSAAQELQFAQSGLAISQHIWMTLNSVVGWMDSLPGAAELGVQLHTHFLASSFGKQSSFVWKNLGLLDKLHTHIYYLPPPLSKHNHYGADCICRSCRGFFMRAVQRNFYQKFQHDNDCIIDSQNRKSCKK